MEAEGLDVGELIAGDGGAVPGRAPAAGLREQESRRRGCGRCWGIWTGSGCFRPGEDVAPTPVDRLLEEFCGYLLEERGLVAGSVGLYERIARRFLEERSEPLADDLARLSGAEVNAFVLRRGASRRPRTAETVVCALRALLRFLHVQGWIATPLATAVPSVPPRREDLPRGLAAGQVQRCCLTAVIARRSVGTAGLRDPDAAVQARAASR